MPRGAWSGDRPYCSSQDDRGQGGTTGVGDDLWIAETLYGGWQQRFRIRAEIVRHRSAVQDIVIVDSISHGRVMLLDGAVQVTEADEFIYQEMIAHVPLLAHGAARRVLIIGAGDGGVLRRVLQHRGVDVAVMVEIDPDVIRLAREHMPEIGGDAWDDPRAEVRVGDGVRYVSDVPSGAFDVIIVDSTDPAGPGEALFSDDFYADCARILRPGGLVANQSGVPFMQADELRTTSLCRARHFSHVSAYVVAVPTYVGGLMTLGLAGHSPGARDVATVGERARSAGILGRTRFWTPEVHAASFALPPYIAELLPT